MNVSLTKELEKFVHDLVKRGRYGSASEVVRDGLRRLIEEREMLRRAQVQWLREAVREGEESAKREGWIKGDDAFWDSIKQEGRRRVAAPNRKRRSA